MAIDIQINLGLAVLIIGSLLAAVGFYYIGYLERKNKPDKKPNIVTRTIIISMVLISVMLMIIYISGNEPSKWHYLGFLFLVLLIYITLWYEVTRTKMKDPMKIQEKQLEYLYDVFEAETDFGVHGHRWPHFKITEVPNGRIFDVLANSLFYTNQGVFLVQSNPYENYVLSHEKDPDMNMIQEIFGETIARRYDAERQQLLYELEAARNDAKEKTTV